MKTTFWLRSGIAYLKQPLAVGNYFALVTVQRKDGVQEPAVLACWGERRGMHEEWWLTPGTDVSSQVGENDAFDHGEWLISGKFPSDFAPPPDYFAPWEEHEAFVDRLAAHISGLIALQDVSLVRVRTVTLLPQGPRHRVEWRRLAARVHIPAHYTREAFVTVDRTDLTGFHISKIGPSIDWRKVRLPLLLSPRKEIDPSVLGSQLCAIIDALPVSATQFQRTTKAKKAKKVEEAACATTPPSS